MRTRKHRGFVLALAMTFHEIQKAKEAMRGPIKIFWLPPRLVLDPFREVSYPGAAYFFDVSSSFPPTMIESIKQRTLETGGRVYYEDTDSIITTGDGAKK